MKGPIFVLIGVAALVYVLANLADDGSVDGGGFGDMYSTICLNGVAYYDGHNTLAPAVDAETLTFIRCSK